MFNLISLLGAAALVSLQYGFEANAQIDNSKINLDNNLQPNVAPSPKRRLRKFVHISLPPPETIRYVPGTRLELDCEVMGSPAPTVQWLKNGEPITEYDDANEVWTSYPRSLARLTSTLIISSSSNGDVYTCLATADLKQESASTTVYSSQGEETKELITLKKLLSTPAAPRIVTFYNEMFQEMGTDLLLPCRVSSYVKSQVFWQDNNGNLIYDNPRIRVLPSGDLFFTGLRWPDMGKYTCTARNVYGKDSITTFVYPAKPEIK